MHYKTLLVIAFVAISLFTASSFSQNSREITKTVPLKADGEVTIDTYKGSITISTWDKPQVEIRAKIEADDAFDTDYSAEKVRDTDIRIDATERRVRIKTDYSEIHDHHHDFWSWFGDDNGSLPLVHYTITMPATANLSIKDYKSTSSLKDLHSNLSFNTYKGDVVIADLEGSLTFETYKGEARVSFTKLTDRSHVKTYKGDITITLPAKSGFDLDADLGYRTDFTTDFDVQLSSRGRHHRNTEFQGPVNGGGATLVLRSTRGNVRLRQR